jgi:hypothetical protein
MTSSRPRVQIVRGGGCTCGHSLRLNALLIPQSAAKWGCASSFLQRFRRTVVVSVAVTRPIRFRTCDQIWVASSCQSMGCGVGGPDFPQMEPIDQLDVPNRRLPEGRLRRFAKRNAASRPPSTFRLNLSLSGTSPIGRLGCCWLRRRGFGAAQGQSWGQLPANLTSPPLDA